MSQTIGYNLHDILKFKINRNGDRCFRDLINLKFTVFEVENVDNPDITLNIGTFKPSNGNCYLVDNKFYIKENYLYCRDSLGNAEWEVEIFGFVDGETTINYNGSLKGYQHIINPDFISQNILLRLIEYKLERIEYFLAHSAGVCRNGNAYVFAGRGGSFKTSLCMDLIRRSNFEFLGDDRIILHKDKIFSFPMNLHLFSFMCKNLKSECDLNAFNKLKFIKYLLDGKTGVNSSIKLSKPCSIKGLFFISKTNSDVITVHEISLKDAIDRLIMNNRLEDFISLGGLGINSGPLFKYVLAYSYIFPENPIIQTTHLKCVLTNILENIPISEVEIPYTYSSKIFNEFSKIIQGRDDL